MVANTLHAAAVLLNQARDWDWFINLSASDYPLVTQDGTNLLLLPRTLTLTKYACFPGYTNVVSPLLNISVTRKIRNLSRTEVKIIV